VLTGKKTGTATLVIELEREGGKMPKVGDHNVILDGKEKPAAVLHTTAIEVKPFNEVKEVFA
jgi:histidinol-phosphate aminotransferase